MRCAKAHKLISIDLDGELDRGRQGKLARHLAACPECRAFAAELAGVSKHLEGLTAPEPRWGFAGRTLARLPAAEPAAAVPRRWRDLLRPVPVGLGAAAFGFGVLVTVLVGNPRQANGSVVKQDIELLVGDYFETLSDVSLDEQLLALLGEAEG